MHILSLWIGKITFKLLQLIGRRGSALPGWIVETLDKKFMHSMLNKLPEGVVVVSGTNGKTTSTKMLTTVLTESGKKVLTNPTGSNFTRGVIATIVQNANWLGKLDFDIAVLELDEAYAAKFVKQHKPRVSLILNVMRDQMDRFGEIDTTAKLLSEVVKNTTEIVVLNRDDPRVESLKKYADCKVEFYGVSQALRDVFRSDDELHGDVVKNNHEVVCQLEKIGDENITTSILNKKHDIPFKLHGIYNAQNACAVIATAISMAIDEQHAVNGVASSRAAFGRGERITIDGKNILLQLVKNPGGFRHSLISGQKIFDHTTIIAINDDYADGRDVSWLWDVDFTSLLNKNIITSGTRAADMALRLSYDEVNVKEVEQDLDRALEKGLSSIKQGDTVHIYTTYTAMLYLRKLIAKKTSVEPV